MTLTDEQAQKTVDVVYSQPSLAKLGYGGINAALVRAGYALGLAAIPREPTQAMVQAGAEIGVVRAVLTWQAMYDAAQGGKPE